MSYTPTAVEIAVYQTIATLLPAGVSLIYANQDGPRPTSGTYATLLVMGDTPIGLRTVEMSDDAGVAPDTYLLRTGQQRALAISVQTFGPAAYAAITSVVSLYESPLTAQAAYDRGVSLTACGEATRVPEALTTETEDRWTVTIQGAYLRTTSQDAAALQEVVGTLYVNNDPDPAATFTVEAP